MRGMDAKAGHAPKKLANRLDVPNATSSRLADTMYPWRSANVLAMMMPSTKPTRVMITDDDSSERTVALSN